MCEQSISNFPIPYVIVPRTYFRFAARASYRKEKEEEGEEGNLSAFRRWKPFESAERVVLIRLFPAINSLVYHVYPSF